MRLTQTAHRWLQTHIQVGDVVVDATLGNGFDAYFLASHIGEQGVLYGFDIQPQAIHNSQKRLKTMPCKQIFFQQGHEHMADCIPQAHHGQVRAIMFNLGWLPHGDKACITRAETTLSALHQAMRLLMPGGCLSVMAYPGHPGGETEAEQVLQWLEQQQQATYQRITLPNRKNAPILLQITHH